MKKITIINKHLGIGGIEKYISELTKRLIKNYKIDLIVSYKIKELPTYHISSKTNISYLVNDFPTYKRINKYLKRKQYYNAFVEYFYNLKLKWFRLIKTIKTIKSINSNYLIVTRLFDAIIVKLLLKDKKIKTIFFINKKYNLFILLILKNKIDKLVVPTLELKNKYSKLYNNKVECISNYYDDNKNKSKLKSKNIISIGNFTKDKNVLELIDIMKEINKNDKEINLILIGDGKKKNKIRSIISKYNLENTIKLTGSLNKLEIEEYMLNSSLYVSSTLRDYYGITLLEAMNYGLPTLCYKSCSKYNCNDELLINNKNKKEFADKVLYLFNNKKLLKNYADNCYNYVNKSNNDNVFDKWKKLIKDLR